MVIAAMSSRFDPEVAVTLSSIPSNLKQLPNLPATSSSLSMENPLPS